MITLLLLPFRLLFFVAWLPFRVAKVPVKVFGARGTLAFAAGVAVGLLAAPDNGAETRRRLRDRYDEWQAARAAPPGWGLDVDG